MDDIPEDVTGEAAASAGPGNLSDDLVDVVDTPLSPAPRLDVGATRAALDAVVMEKDLVDVENNLLSDHLMVPLVSSEIVPSLMSCSGRSVCLIGFPAFETIDGCTKSMPQPPRLFARSFRN